MGNRLVIALREALRLAREKQETAGRSPAGRQLAICVTDLEAALLRAMLATAHDGLCLLPEDREPELAPKTADSEQLDWDWAEAKLKSVLEAYASIGPAGAFGAGVVAAAQARFDKGERTAELHAEITEIE